MIASLPMYDRRETAGANDRLWAAMRARLGPAAPARLSRVDDPWDHWQSPELAFSQTCGMPYRTRLRDHVTLVGAPVFDLPCPAGQYFSVLVIRTDDARASPERFAGARLAANDPLSQSGWCAPQSLMLSGGLPAFRDILWTGAHRHSARAVAEGRADIAALDAVTWTMIRRWDPAAGALRVLAETPPTPAMPYIAAQGADAPALLDALSHAIAALSAADRGTLCLTGAIPASPDAYLAVPTPDLGAQ